MKKKYLKPGLYNCLIYDKLDKYDKDEYDKVFNFFIQKVDLYKNDQFYEILPEHMKILIDKDRENQKGKSFIDIQQKLKNV